MKRLELLVWLLSLICPTAWAAPFFSDASLSGTYSVQFASPETAIWSKTFSCPSNSTITFTINGGVTTENVAHGTATFHGNGGWSFSVTQIGQVDSTASANTTSVTWNSACQVVSENHGHVVYKASSTSTGTGTYVVQSNGTGTLSATSVSLTFILAGTNASGVASTILLTNPQVNGKSIGDGIAVHQ